jgi:hypothetical protein
MQQGVQCRDDVFVISRGEDLVQPLVRRRSVLRIIEPERGAVSR